MFAWTYADMPELDTSIVTRKLSLKPECKPVQQKLRRMRPTMLLQIRDEIRKQFDARFLRVAKYPEWVANVVPVPKKNGKVRMCVVIITSTMLFQKTISPTTPEGSLYHISKSHRRSCTKKSQKEKT
ncbi:hypothetical protein GQ457_02G027710 [Hibiscus cannabinus]